MMWDNEYDTLNFNKLKAVKEYYEPHTRLNNVNMHHSYCYETWRQFTELDEYEQYVCWRVGGHSVHGSGEIERFAEYKGLPLMSRDEFERVNGGLEPAVPAPGMDCRVARSSQRRENLGNDGTPKIEGTVIIKGQKWRIEVW